MYRSLTIFLTSLVIVLMLGFVTGVFAAPAAKPLKIAYVEVSRVFDEYQHTVDAEKELEALKEEKQKEIDKKVAEIDEMKNGLESLSKSDKETKEAAIDEKVKTLKERNKKIKEDLVKNRDEKVKEILKEIKTFIEQHAGKNGYDFILNDRMMLYKEKSFDLSDEIIRQLNEQYQKAKK